MNVAGQRAPKQSATAMIVILLVAFVLRLTWAWHLRHETSLFGDGPLYDYFARGFLDGHYPEDSPGFRSMMPPGYPAFLAALYRVVGVGQFTAVRLAQCLLGTLSIYIVARIAQRLFDQRVALLTAVILAVYPYGIFYASVLMSETLFSLLVALNVLGVFALRSAPSPKRGLLVGVVAGLAMLTRPQHLLFVAASVLWLVITSERAQSLARRLVAPLFLVVACSATVLPWTVRNYVEYHELLLVSDNGTDVLWWGNNPLTSRMYLTEDQAELKRLDAQIWGPEGERVLRRNGRTLAEKGRDVRALVVGYVRAHPGEWFHAEVKKLVAAWRPWLGGTNSRAQSAISLLTYGTILVFGLPFLVWCSRSSSPNADESRLLLIVCALYTLVSVAFVALSRYRFPVVDPYLAIYASGAVFAVLRRRTSDQAA